MECVDRDSSEAMHEQFTDAYRHIYHLSQIAEGVTLPSSIRSVHIGVQTSA